MASNPAFNRIEKDAKDGYAGFGGPGASAAQQSAAAQAATAGMSAQQLQDLYNQPSAGPVDTRRVTMDDVIMKTLAPLRDRARHGRRRLGRRREQPGRRVRDLDRRHDRHARARADHRVQEDAQRPADPALRRRRGPVHGRRQPVLQRGRWPGIVGQAVLATLATFAGMFLAYKFGLIKVTAKFRRIMTMMIFGYAIFAIVNFIFAVVTTLAVRLRRHGGLGIAISVFAVGLASFTLALDFDSIEGAIRTGAPQKYSWLLAHGLIVTLVWLYIEFLRLFARLRS